MVTLQDFVSVYKLHFYEVNVSHLFHKSENAAFQAWLEETKEHLYDSII